MKILYNLAFDRLKYGGVTSYVKLLVDNLDPAQFSAYNLASTKQFIIGKRGFFQHHLTAITNLLRFPSVVNDIQPDVVHLNASLNWVALIREILYLQIAFRLKVPTVFSIHGWNWHLYKVILRNPLLKSLIRKTFVKASRIIVLSGDFERALIDLGIDQKKIMITTTMVSASHFQHLTKTFERPFTVLWCSRMIREKGIFEAIDAIPKIVDSLPDTHFLFVGDGPLLRLAEQRSRRNGIDRSVEFAGYQDDKAKIASFLSSHLLVFPSYSEGFPTVVLEAMAAGLPVITTKVGGLKDVFKDNENGLFLDQNPPNPDEISSKIVFLLSQPMLMNSISALNSETARSKYDVSVKVRAMQRLYEELVQEGGHENPLGD